MKSRDPFWLTLRRPGTRRRLVQKCLGRYLEEERRVSRSILLQGNTLLTIKYHHLSWNNTYRATCHPTRLYYKTTPNKKKKNTQAAAQTCLKLFLFDRIVNCHKKRGGSIERLRIVPLVWMAQRVWTLCASALWQAGKKKILWFKFFCDIVLLLLTPFLKTQPATQICWSCL